MNDIEERIFMRQSRAESQAGDRMDFLVDPQTPRKGVLKNVVLG